VTAYSRGPFPLLLRSSYERTLHRSEATGITLFRVTSQIGFARACRRSSRRPANHQRVRASPRSKKPMLQAGYSGGWLRRHRAHLCAAPARLERECRCRCCRWTPATILAAPDSAAALAAEVCSRSFCSRPDSGSHPWG